MRVSSKQEADCPGHVETCNQMELKKYTYGCWDCEREGGPEAKAEGRQLLLILQMLGDKGHSQMSFE